MSIILNIIVLFLCLRWLHISDQSSSMLLKIICSFILGTFISFVLAFVFDNEYLQGVAHLITSGGSAVVFWLTSIILLFISKHKTSTADRLGKVLLMSMVLVVPVLIYSLISNMSFKIGG